MMYGFNFNLNQTIKTYRGTDSPLFDETFRKAIAHLVDKDYSIREIFSYRAERIDVPIPTSQSDWWNASVTDPNYPYEFSPTRADELLNQRGFTDREGDGRRNYPSDWWPREKAGANLDSIIFYVDSTDSIRVAMADSLAGQMGSIGIPVDLRKLPPIMLYDHVLVDRDYHIFMGSQLVSSIPLYLFMLGTFTFMETCWGKQWSFSNLWENCPYIIDFIEAAGLKVLYTMLKCSSSVLTAQDYAKAIQSVYTQHVFEVPVCSVQSHFAYRKNIAGVVNENEYGIDNLYTFLNAYRTDDPNQPVRVGIVYGPIKFNVLYSTHISDYQCLDKIYAGLINHQPYNQVIDQPWVAQDWEVGEWVDPDDGKIKTVVTYYLRKDVYWVKPVTGEIDRQFTAKDYEFTCHYIYAQYPFIPEAGMGCPHLNKFEDVHHVEVLDDYTVSVFMNVNSMWAYLWPTYPLLPKHKWLRDPLAYSRSTSFEASSISLPGELPLGDYVVSGSDNTSIKVRLVDGRETWLVWGEHFMWKMGNLYVMTDSVDGVEIDKLWVDYWVNGKPQGFYPGNLQWQDILEGCGTHYVTGIDEYQSFICKANRNFFLETPILGEVDWAWEWVGTTAPRSGRYAIRIYDVSYATAGYSKRGDGEPPSNWFPGADIDPTDVGHIGINDIVTIVSNFGKTFGTPPQ